MRKARKSLAILLAVAMVFCMAPAMVFGAGDDGQVNRIAGNDRYITSAETALRAFESADTVLIARGDDEGGFADGLAASYLAGVENAPILLTEPNGLPPVVKDAISKLGAKKAIILGGPAVVSDKVKDDLAGLEVERIFGDDRFETAAKIAAKGKADTAFVVSGYAPADSLVAGPLAFSKNYPILLVGNNVPDFTSKALADLGIKNIYVIGGTGVVSESVYNDLAAKADQIVRYGGNDRVATSLEVAQNLYTNPVNFSIVGYDGLADAVGAAVFGNPILYTDSDLGISGIQSYLAGAVTADSNVNIFGGTGVVSNAAETALENIVPDELKVEIVSAIDATTLEVTFEGVEEPVTIELAEALVHGDNEVTFEYEGVEYTVTVNYVDPTVIEQEKSAAIKDAVAKINLIGNPADLTLEDEAKVVEARTAVDAALALGAVEADIANLDHLVAAETQIKSLKDALNEKEAAIQDANVAITNLPLAANITLENKEAVEAARELVDNAIALGAEESDILNLWKLEAAEAKIAELEAATDAEAANAVEEAIAALPALEDLTLEDAEAVEAAREAYTALTESQQELVPNVDVLVAAEAKIKELEEAAASDAEKAAAVEDQITALPAAEELTLENATAVAEARAAYNALTEAQKALVTNVADLVAAETKIAELEAVKDAEKAAAITAAEKAIATLPSVEEVTIEDKADVLAAKDLVAAVRALDEEAVVEGEEVIAELEAKIGELEAAKDAEEQLAAAITAAEEAIATLPSVEEVTIEDKADVLAAKDLVAAVRALDEEAVVEGEEVIAELETKIVELEEAVRVENVQATTDNNTKVTTVTATVINAEEGTTAKVEIFAVDEEGNTVEDAVATASGVNIAEGVIKGDIDVVSLESGDYKVVVTVGEATGETELKLDFTAVDEAVEAVNKATTQIQLWDALQNELFGEAPKYENIVAYAEEMLKDESNYNTVAEVIEAVEGINDSLVAGDLLAKLKAEKNQFKFLELLRDNFGEELINNDLVIEYQTEIGKLTEASTKDEIKAVIVNVNESAPVINMINELPAAADDLTLKDKAAVEAAREAYDALTEAQKALVTNVADLEAAEAKIEKLEAPREASFISVNSIGIHENKVYEGYELKDKQDSRIDLVANNIKEMTVLEPDATEPKALIVGDDTDPLLWFNVEKAAGEYEYTVVTNNDVTYKATINWTAPVEATPELLTAEPEVAPNGNSYVEYSLGNLDLSSFTKMYQIKPDKTAVELTANTDKNLWFKVKDGKDENWKQQEGDHIFLIKKDNTWHKAVIKYAEGQIVEAALAAVNEASDKKAMIEAIEKHADVLGLNIGEDSDYAKLVNYPSETNSRHWSVGVDLVNNKQYEENQKYTLEKLQPTFNAIVATRLVTQESMDLVNKAETLEDIGYVTMLLERFEEASTIYETHSGIALTNKVATLQDLVDRYNALSEDYQAEVLEKIISVRPEGGFARSQATTDALEKALGEVEAKIAPNTAREAVYALFVDAEADQKALAEGVTQADINEANDLVKKLDDGDVKTNLTTLVGDAQILLENQVTEAVNALTDENDNLVADKAEIDAAKELVEALDCDEETKSGLQEKIDVAYINLAIDTNDAPALQAIIVGYGNSDFNNLTRAQRAELVQFIIDEVLTAEEYTPVTSTEGFGNSILSSVTSYKAAITAVNEAENNTNMVEALKGIHYDVFDNLTTVQQLDVAAELVAIADKDFTTFKEIKTAVDTAIAELRY
jgi:putative cell wall-binding protein